MDLTQGVVWTLDAGFLGERSGCIVVMHTTIKELPAANDLLLLVFGREGQGILCQREGRDVGRSLLVSNTYL